MAQSQAIPGALYFARQPGLLSTRCREAICTGSGCHLAHPQWYAQGYRTGIALGASRESTLEGAEQQVAQAQALRLTLSIAVQTHTLMQDLHYIAGQHGECSGRG